MRHPIPEFIVNPHLALVRVFDFSRIEDHSHESYYSAGRQMFLNLSDLIPRNEQVKGQAEIATKC